MAHPIWSDYFVTFDGDRCDFTIEYDGNIIYEGSAARRPNEQNIRIKINDICADYMRKQPIYSIFWLGTSNEPYEYAFKVTVYDDTTTEVEDVVFTYNYSYDRMSLSPNVINAPIAYVIPASAVLPTSSTGTIYVELFDGEGSIIEYPIPGVTPAEGMQLNAFVYLRNYSNFSEISVYRSEIGRQNFSVVPACAGQYVLYYRNALGGIDFLFVEGKALLKDDYTRHTIGIGTSNDVEGARQKANYQNDIARSWALHTGWIDDAGAANMHHLLGSTDVVLLDTSTNTIYSVNILNNKCEYKTYSNNGNRLVRYDIEVEFAQKMIRR